MKDLNSLNNRAESPKTVASIEARMGSSRLPGKVLMDIEGKPALTRVYERLKQCKTLDGIILATSTNATDDVLEQWALENECPLHRGDEEDVLGRVVDAHVSMDSDIIVEMHGDCVLLDPKIIDLGVETFISNDVQIVSTSWKQSFPIGVDVQVFGFNELAYISENIDDYLVREHVSLYFYEHPEKYKIINLIAPHVWAGNQYRFILDYPEDLEFVCQVYKNLIPIYGDVFGVELILDLITKMPELTKINDNCKEHENIVREKK
jgi:spore coat polysaccharide biosynthesis protein SpsF